LSHCDALASLAQPFLALLFRVSGFQALGRLLVRPCQLAVSGDVVVAMNLVGGGLGR
jgi:hypothetical protein